jgi:DHA1 family tetracycline resistance protein-like MFS transporter
MQDSEAITGAAGPTVPPVESQPASNRSALMIVFLVVFIDLLGFGIVLPLLPRFADENVAALIGLGKEDPLGGFIVGMLMSSFSLMQFLFAPVWGRVSDRVGRRPILLLGLIGSVVFYALLGYALSIRATEAPVLALVLLFLARIGAGVAGATIATAQAVIADCTPPEKRKHGMALIGAAFGIGFTFGPLFGFASLYWFKDHHEVIGYTAAGLSFIALLLGLRLLPETRRFGAPTTTKQRLLNWSAAKSALSSPALGPVILTFFLGTLGFGAFEVTLALLLKDAMNFNDRSSFLIFAFIGFVLLLTQGFLYRRLARRLSEVTFVTMGILFMAAGVAGLGAVSWLGMGPRAVSLAETVTSIAGLLSSPAAPLESLIRSGIDTYSASGPLLSLLFASLVASVVGFSFLTPSAQALVSRRTDADRQGEILGVNQSAAALARILGPVLGVTLYKSTATHLLPYAFGAGLLLLMLPLMPRIRRG